MATERAALTCAFCDKRAATVVQEDEAGLGYHACEECDRLNGNDAAGLLADEIMEYALAGDHFADGQVRKDIAAGLTALYKAGPEMCRRFVMFLADNFKGYNH